MRRTGGLRKDTFDDEFGLGGSERVGVTMAGLAVALAAAWVLV